MAVTSQKRSGTTDLTVGKPLFRILRFALPLVLESSIKKRSMRFITDKMTSSCQKP